MQSAASSSTSAVLLLAIAVTALAVLGGQVAATTNVAQLYSSKSGQLTTSSALVWSTFVGADDKQLAYAVRAGKVALESNETYSMLVCRVAVEGVYITGHSAQHLDDRTVCVVSMHMEVRNHHAFDVLLNKGNGAKLSWAAWSKFAGRVPSGAVSAASAGHIDDSFVARRAATAGEHHHVRADYFVGRFAPKEGLGKVFVIEARDEKAYEDGEILVETEPIRYELRDIKLLKSTKMVTRNKTLLGATTLENTADTPNLVKSIISYNYIRMCYWGTLDGVPRGMPTDVYESGKPVMQIEWGLRKSINKTDTKAVSANLQPGTAINVTIEANYTKIEAQYKATLVSYFENTTETLKRHVMSTFLSTDITEDKYHFSPIYWLHNMTLVPTTTTTTTTSTTSTTSSTTPSSAASSSSTDKEARPANAPPLEFADDDDAGGEDARHNSAEDKQQTQTLSAAVAAVPSTSSGPRHLTQSAVASSWIATLATVSCLLASRF